MKRLAWAVTGGGSNLRAVAEAMLRIKTELGVKVTTFFSKWGYEVARIFGVLPLVKRVSGGGYYEEVLVGDEAMYLIGRFNLRRYDLLVVAPATSNTIAKMAYGIADTSPTAAYAQAVKSGIPVVVLPTDVPSPQGTVVTESPCYVDRERCLCPQPQEECQAARRCPAGAIEASAGVVRVNLSRCSGCAVCVSACPYGAVKCWDKVTLSVRRIDAENVERLRRLDGTVVVSSVSELVKEVKKHLAEAPRG